ATPNKKKFISNKKASSSIKVSWNILRTTPTTGLLASWKRGLRSAATISRRPATICPLGKSPWTTAIPVHVGQPGNSAVRRQADGKGYKNERNNQKASMPHQMPMPPGQETDDLDNQQAVGRMANPALAR